ncbi:MAG TPA: 3'-5' exonuclease [Acetobacteraceae bacterium]|nr:3'-5' exonuclease [Acetobacteraceae bacterium]
MAGGIGDVLRGLAARLLAGPPALPAGPWPEGDLAAIPYVVFDLEATGLRPSRGDAIVQIGAVRLEGLEEAGRFSTLVNPGRPIPPASTRYHGITDQMVRDAPGVAEALEAFDAFAGGAVLVAHNAAFDGALLGMAARAGAPGLANPLLCTVAVSRWLDPAEPDHSLDGLCGRRGIVIEGRHQALGDARATAALWRDLAARAASRGVDDLGALAQRSRMAEAMEASAARF